MNRRAEFSKGRSVDRDQAIPADIGTVAADWVARRDAGLSVAEERAYAAWCDADPRHRAAIARLEYAWSALDQPRLTGTADAALGELNRRAGRRRRHLAMATAALVLLAGVGAGWRLTPSVSPLSAAPAATAAVLLPALQSLPDGSLAELRDGGAIAVSFTSRQRRVELARGEVFFKVAKDAARPFVVVVDGVEFRAVGTAFSVQRDNASIELLVTEGTVAVAVAASASSASENIPTPPLLVGAGNGATVRVATDGAQSRISAVPHADVQTKLAWRSPRLEFSGAQLIEAVALMNRHNRLQFVIEDPELAKVRVSGIFGAANTAAFVGLLEASFNVEAERRGEFEIVLRPRR